MTNKLMGYNGKIAYIDLTAQKVEVKDLDPEIAKNYLGGTGLSAKIVYDFLSEENYKVLKGNPLNEINPLVFATGPVTGTIRPSSGRYSVSGISPLTGIWGEGTSGGYFCISLHNSGFDAIVFTGKAKEPIYILIENEVINFKNASNVWGKDCYETQKVIKQELNNDKVRIACIGIAGENLVKYAAIINDEGRAVGRCGMGTLMGSKNLKAVAIHGTKKIEIADNKIGKQYLKEEEEEAAKDFIKSAAPYAYSLYGTNAYMDLGMILGDTTAFYYSSSEFLAEKLVAKTLKEDYTIMDYGCAGCTLRCGKATVVKVNGKEIVVDGPEYESLAAFGPQCGLLESKEVILASHMCNVYGFDTISGGVSIAFLIYLVENNLNREIISKFLKDIKIEEIKWGNAKLIHKLIEKIAKREDIGAILAEGTRFMAKKFEVDSELAAHVKGLEIPMHDPRAFAGQALSYMTGCCGANHNKCDWFAVEIGNVSFPNIRVKSGDKDNIDRRERGVANLQDLRAIDDSAVNCNFRNPSLEHIIGYVNAATGFGYNKKTLLLVGERINNLKRLINCKLGISRKDDKLPEHVTKVLQSGKTAGVKLNLEENLKKYYEHRGWDWETGQPTEEKLKELEI